MPVPRAQRPTHLAPLRASVRAARRSPRWASGRRVTTVRGLFPPCLAIADDDPPHVRLTASEWLLVVAAIAAMADLLSMQIAPALALPFYTFTVAVCVLVTVIALVTDPDAAAKERPEPVSASRMLPGQDFKGACHDSQVSVPTPPPRRAPSAPLAPTPARSGYARRSAARVR